MKKPKRKPRMALKKRVSLRSQAKDIESLRNELAEAQETLRAIQSGDVDALVVNGADGEKIFTLKSDDQPYRVLVETMNEGEATLDSNGTIFYCNSCLARFVGQSLEQTIGKTLIDFVFPDDRHEFKRLFQVAKSGRSRGEIRMGTKVEALLPTLFSMSSVNLETGLGISLVITDLTEQKRLAKSAEDIQILKDISVQNEAAKSAAEEANKLKSAFLANMSHEIRTPLGAMIGFAELLADPDISESERAASVDVLMRNGHQLAALINDILDLSKVESGHLSLEKIPTDPAAIASEVISLLNVMAKEKGLTLDLNIEPGLPRSVSTDPIRLRQIITNIVGNAIKFTRVGGVTVHVTASPKSGNETSVLFDVTDTGVGIPQADVVKLFQVFSQADESITRKFGGTGLGLVLSKKLANALGGDVKLMSTKKNRGSTFRISITAKRDVETDPHNVGDPQTNTKRELLQNVSLLVVEDSPDNQQLIYRILSKHGVTIEVAENGLEGVEKALNGQHDLVLMDIQMPVMDGYTATEKLRASGYTKPIIALTAHAMNEIRIKCMKAGCTDHLTKPINFKDLVAIVAKYSATRNENA